MRFRFRRRRKTVEIYPDEILIDSSNPADFDRDQFEGRMEQPIERRSFFVLGVLLAVAFVFLTGRAGLLQIVQGSVYATQAKENQLHEKVLFADRGIITDRNGVELAYNEKSDVSEEFANRVYSAIPGVAHIVGYVKEPAKDAHGFFYRDEFLGMDGAEEAFQQRLQGENGVTLAETNATGDIVSQSVERSPKPGEKLVLSIDAKVTEGLYTAIAEKARSSGFQGGAGVVIDVETGEIVALTSFPEYSSQALTDGDSATISALNTDPKRPFLDRAISGLYSPGSIVKPIMGVAALTEGVIDEKKQILSTGSISLPNPYDPDHPSIFKDWRANGWVDLRHAIAVSSDVYFYEVGGGFEDQAGLGIARIEKYFNMFGFGLPTGFEGFGESVGSISSPEWKEEHFPGDPWRIGDTYHTAIGQYGTQVTPLQAVRAIAAIANGGKLLVPTILASTTPRFTQLSVPAYNFSVVREGMRLGVTEGIAQAVSFSDLHVAAKTGTAQVGVRNEYLNSWLVGFWPYEKPRYAFAIVLERGPAGTLVGASAAGGEFLSWLRENASQYMQ